MKTEHSKDWNQKMTELRKHESPLNFDLEWDGIVQRMEQKRKRRIMPFWIVLAGITVCSVGAGFYYFDQAVDGKGEKAEEILLPQNSKVGEVEQATAGFENMKSGLLNSESKARILTPRRELAAVKSSSVMGSLNAAGVKEMEVHQENEAVNAIEATAQEQAFEASKEKNEAETINGNNTHLFILPIKNMAAGRLYGPEIIMTLPIESTSIQPAQKRMWIFVQGGAGIQDFGYHQTAGETKLTEVLGQIEQPSPALLGRIGLGRELGHRYFVQLGLSGSKTYEQHSGSRMDTVKTIQENVLISSYRDHEGSLVEEYGNVESTVIKRTQMTRNPTLNQLGLYLGIGRYYALGKGLVRLEAGYTHKIWGKLDGKAIDEHQREVNMSQRYRLGSSNWSAGLGYSHALWQKLWLDLGCEYNRSSLLAPVGYSRVSQVLSGQVGLRWMLR
ncbi:MAG: hypothetical protein IPH36_06270 [Saprospiraceae bacterium]|nr:hypothetical protein [Saprospiraceae bacterium]